MRKLLFCLFLLQATGTMAQVDPHFSQFYAQPLWLNPGMTGIMEGDYRITGIYRKQWNDAAPFTTAGVSAEIATNKNISFGLNFLNQTAGNAGYTYMNAYASVAYNGMKFGTDNAQQISFGIQAGLLSRKFDPAKFQFGDQWNPSTGYNPANPTSDALSYTSVAVLDIGAGAFYQDGTEGRALNFFGGVSAFHLTRPEDPFISRGDKQKLPVRYVAHAGARINLSDVFSLVPNLLYMRQGSAQEKMLGLYADLKANNYTSVLLGTYYRAGDAFSPYIGLSWERISVGASYDVNVSELGEMAGKSGSIELSLTYNGRSKGKPMRYLGCPRF